MKGIATEIKYALRLAATCSPPTGCAHKRWAKKYTGVAAERSGKRTYQSTHVQSRLGHMGFLQQKVCRVLLKAKYKSTRYSFTNKHVWLTDCSSIVDREEPLIREPLSRYTQT